jgi:hypothetical protein
LRKSKGGGELTFEQRDCEITTVFISFEPELSPAITTQNTTCLPLIAFCISVSEETGKGKHTVGRQGEKKDRIINRIRKCSETGCANNLRK